MIRIAPRRTPTHFGEHLGSRQEPTIATALLFQGCFSPDQPAPVNYGRQLQQTFHAQRTIAPKQFALEAQYQPLYAGLENQDLNILLNGDGTNPGLLQMYQNAMPGLVSTQTAANTAQRTADIADVNNLASAGRQALRTANPDAAALLDKLNQQAGEGLDAGSMLTADQMRNVTNSLNASMGARGVAYGPAASYADVLGTSQYGDQLALERQNEAGNVLNENQNFYGDPYQQILGRTSGAGGVAGALLAGSQNSKSGPALFNPESPLSAAITAGNQQMNAMFAGSTAQDASNAVAPMNATFASY